MTYKISRELMGSRALNLGRTTAGLCFQELLHLLSGRAHSAAGDAQPLGRFWATGYRVACKETASVLPSFGNRHRSSQGSQKERGEGPGAGHEPGT